MTEQKYHINLSALKGRVIEKYGTLQKFSEIFDCSYTHVLDLFSGKTGWTLPNVYKVISLLGLDGNMAEINRIFFSQEN